MRSQTHLSPVSTAAPTSIRQLKGQGPMYLIGVAHGATHWLLGTFYILVPVLRSDLASTRRLSACLLYR